MEVEWREINVEVSKIHTSTECELCKATARYWSALRVDLKDVRIFDNVAVVHEEGNQVYTYSRCFPVTGGSPLALDFNEAHEQ
jgi:hypothetical protein